MRGAKASGLSRNFQPYHPILFFMVFLAGNSILSYGPWGAGVKAWVFLMFILVPFVLGLLFRPGQPFRNKDLVVPAWAWGLVLGAGVLLRFRGLISIPVWPMWDDADCAYDSIHLMEHWQWSPVSGQIRLPSMFFWFEALLFKAAGPSLFTLWLLPALFSLGGLALGVGAARRWSPGLWGFLAASFLALGFWPLYMGRFSIPASLAYLWMMGACAGLAYFWRAGRSSAFAWPSWALGIWCGLGFYVNSKTYLPILVIALFFLGHWWTSSRRRWTGLLPFFLPLAVLGTPEVPVLFFDVSQGHAHDFMIFSGTVDWSQQWSVSLSYLTVFLWGVLNGTYFHFGPLWGGFYNPLLGSLLLVGLMEAARGTSRRVGAAWGAVTVLFLLPGVCSRTLEMFRVLPFLPLGLALAASGGVRVLAVLGPRTRYASLALLLVLSTGLDLYHLEGPFHDASIPGPRSLDSKSPERYRAFQVLDQVQRQEGPGLILTEFPSSVFDQSLLVACFPFNAARNPGLAPGRARWAGLLVDSSLASYFRRHFPQAQVHELFHGIPAWEGLIDLILLPLDDTTRPIALRWAAAHQGIQDLFGTMPYHLSHPSFAAALGSVQAQGSLFRDDPFLRACYWQKLFILWGADDATADLALANLDRAIRDDRGDASLGPHEGFLLKECAAIRDRWKKDPEGERRDLYRALDRGYRSDFIFRRLVLLEVQRHHERDALAVVLRRFKDDPTQAQDPDWAALYQGLSGTTGRRNGN